MKSQFRLLVIFVLSLMICGFVTGTVQAQSQIGVGIMPGVIRVDKPVLPGGQYKLPSLQVVNTGNVTSQYELVIVKMAKQIELQPPAEFISYSPKSFSIEPGANQVVSLSLDIPINAIPGDYLAYVEAHPVSRSTGGTTIGIAAATKLYFTIMPASIFQALINTVTSAFSRAAPFSYIVLGIPVMGLTAFFAKRYIKLEIKLKRKEK